jgi:parvulin-like peptidyl-prolyl isomerase
MSDVASLKVWLQGQGRVRVLLAEAKRRQLDQEPSVREKLRNAWEQYLLEGEYALATLHAVDPTPAEVEAFYETVKDRFAQVTSAHVLVVVTPDSAKVMRLIQGVAAGKGLREAAQAADPSLAVSDETLHFPNADPEWNQAAMALAQMQPNQYLNPQRTPAGWRIAQLLEKQQAPTPYARVPESVRQSIAQHLLDTAREKAFAVYADSLQKALKPTILTENLARVQWPTVTRR